jgi:predicted dehydrogenase
MSDIRIGVVGAGIMGANHARVARQLRGATLAAVVDPDLARARALAGNSGAGAHDDVDAVLGDIDLAVVAAPTAHHRELVTRCLTAGVHVLVEKPIASSVDEGLALVDLAAQAGLVLAVGHVERFNAAVVELPRLLDDPVHIVAKRVSPYSPRIADGVIHDLMIHDIDIVLSLIGPDVGVTSVAGVARTTKGTTDDLTIATVAFDNGLTASFETSRIAQQKIRTIEVTQHDSVIHADLVRQDVTVHRMTRHEYLADDGVRYRQSSVIEVPFLDQRGEPLVRELQDVVDAVRGGGVPTVGGADGVRALALADAIADAVHRRTSP